ncbi:hypothetical protein PIB30_051656 [Stylosanthes scabra]|uniref:Uncharacterized protein n=1 Tax=Stylosanthes scabra TaxID=79078 RepID=A0ABU6YIG1_9FABA|nr:hypothetical protein [Stylosanthes scabra]
MRSPNMPNQKPRPLCYGLRRAGLGSGLFPLLDLLGLDVLGMGFVATLGGRGYDDKAPNSDSFLFFLLEVWGVGWDKDLVAPLVILFDVARLSLFDVELLVLGCWA